jgi:aspartyl-tRNA(Asn)/glutamyl-tRNA(Gln) amidotransferase subunit A
MLSVVAGFDPGDRHSLPSIPLDVRPPEPGQLRVVASEDLGFAALDDDVRHAFRATLDRLTAAGVDVITDGPGLGSSLNTWSVIALAEARASEADELESHRDDLGPAALDFLLAGEQVSIGTYLRAQFDRERIHRAYVDLFARTGAAVLLTPTVGCEAFPHGSLHPPTIGGVPVRYPDQDWGPHLYDANLAGLPACALPMGLGDEGLPVSLQVTGPRCTDGYVLAAAQTIEQVIGFAERPPEPPSPT